jgi:hypothetical protein
MGGRLWLMTPSSPYDGDTSPKPTLTRASRGVRFQGESGHDVGLALASE